ncbi:hypothetical protein RDABS01_006398 [Bienertia sinuspersici]
MREMIELMKNSRCLEVYVLHGLGVPALTPTSYPFERLARVELSGGSDSSDPNYIPGSEKGVGENPLFGEVYTDEESEDSGEYEEEELNATNDGDEGLEQINESASEDLDELEFEEDDEEILDDELQYQSDSGDEEYILARQRVRDTTAKLVDNAKQIQKQAAKGQNIPDQGKAEEPSTVESGFQSEYEDSEEEIHTPPNSGDEALDDRRKRRSGLLVSKFTDFASFKWKVGQKFATRGDFKNAVAKYGIFKVEMCISLSVTNTGNKGGYMEALKASSPGTYMELVTEKEKQELPPIFKRLFISFDGLKERVEIGM